MITKKNSFIKNHWISKIIIILMLVTLYTLVVLILRPCVVNDKSDNAKIFSAERAYQHIQQIAQKPHYHTYDEVDSEAYNNLKEVRNYLENTLKSMSVVTYKRSYPIGTKYATDYYNEKGNQITEERTLNYDIVNYIVEFKGKNDTAILLSAHYDSAPPNYWPNIYSSNNEKKDIKGVSNGAADNGIGVGTILEIVRLLKLKSQAGQLENSVKLLINDGEELGYLGVRLELQKQKDYYNNVGFVVNLEARGTKGNSIMFETVKMNSRIIDLYSKGKNKFATSLSSFITAQLFDSGSYTDFGQYTENGFVGVGFANVNSFDDYHSAKDNLSNVSKLTLQQLGNQIYPMVLEFIHNPKYSDVNYFKTGEEMIFFVVMPNLFISMNLTTQYIIVIILIIVALALLIIKVKNRWTSFGKSLLIIIPIILLMIIMFALAYVFSILTGLIANVKFEFVNMYGIGRVGYFSSGIFTAFIFIFLIIFLNLRQIKKYKSEIEIATMVILLLASLTTLIFMPHATHLFSIMLFYSLWIPLKDLIKSENAKFCITSLIILLLSFFYFPNLTEIFYSLGFGGFSIVIILGFIPLFMIGLLLNNCDLQKITIKRAQKQ